MNVQGDGVTGHGQLRHAQSRKDGMDTLEDTARVVEAAKGLGTIDHRDVLLEHHHDDKEQGHALQQLHGQELSGLETD
eukprot:617812-Heterocapsa_arctica.AAC.1